MPVELYKETLECLRHAALQIGWHIARQSPTTLRYIAP